MRYSLMNKITLTLLIAFLPAISGCSSMLGYMPAPPDSMVKIELKDTYDVDIPKKYVNQLKWASVMSDWAIPYIFMNVGLHFESVDDELRSIHFFDRAITEVRKRKDVYGEGTVTNRKVIAFCKFGKMQDAYNAIKEAEKNWPDAPLNAFVFQNYGHYYLMNGDYNKALKYFRQSFKSNQNFRDDFNLLMLRRDTELEYGMAVILAGYIPVKSTKLTLLDFDEGIFHLNQVIVLDKEIGKTKIDQFTPDIVFHTIESNVYNFLGLAYIIKGQFPEALKNLDTSMKLARKADFREGEIKSIFFRNQVYLLEKNITEGQKVAQQLNEIADKYHLPFYQIWAKFILSRYYQGFDDTSKAINLLKEAVAIMEKQRGELAINMLKETFPFNRQALYETLIELLAEEGDYKGALETAERAKAWGMVDLLAGKNIGKNSTEAELIKQDKNYINEMAEGYRKVLAAAGGDFAWKKALDKIEKTENAHRDVIIKIKAQNEELYSLIFVESLNTDEMRQLLDKNTTLFSYYITDKVLYVWAMNKDRVHLERIKITREEVAKLISSFIVAITAKDKNQAESLSEKVYSIFLKPVIPFVSGDRIGFIPHGPLHYLPFAAMSYKGQYLVEGFSIFYLPGAGVLKYVLKKKPAQGSNVLAFANPDLGNKQLDLPYAEAEVESIKKIIPQATIFFREEVTKTKAKAMIGSYDIVHFAAHGLFVEDAPMNSGILLTPTAQDDGHLTAAEIFKLQFRGRVVVISACKKAPGISSTGEGIVALNRSFLYAGSPSVVTTIWNVDDNSTAAFMDIFYRNLEKNESIADSLRVTQNEMIRLGYMPFDWAAFILTGKY